ncbi:MAG: ATP-dependent DNA helicase RecG [Gemmatimonadota bacterium]|nr:MAG: ATP-dependent DNA helicase RecG [Gemmatimonadota bacterium]
MGEAHLLDRSVQYLKGVGPRRAEALAKLGIRTARDLLRHGPHRYEDATTVTAIAKLAPGMDATAIGEVVSKGVIPTRRGLRFFQAVIKDSSGLIECSWPGQPFLDRTIRKGDTLLVSGPVRFFHGRQIQPREFTILARAGETVDEEGTVFPVYPATAGLSHRQIRHIVRQNLDALLAAVDDAGDIVPDDLRRRLELANLREALDWLHRPPTLALAEQARRRLAFDELFILQVLYARARYENREKRQGIAFERKNGLVRTFAESLPFELTAAQKKVLTEISGDMSQPRPMNRLLQGDVGSGKTVVALFAMLRAVENGYQAALMAPTELLAEQHHKTVTDMLADSPVNVELLRGGFRASQRRDALERISGGEAQLIIGTHALIQEDVEFQRLGLVIIDEQHRFGVRQRLQLRRAGAEPDVLVMSATPIPRSLALTFYGDLDVSVLDGLPPGRRPVKTVLRGESARARVFEFVRTEVEAGRQVYVVYPVIEESEALDVRSATEAYEHLSNEVLSELSVALIHGRMTGDEKDETMRRFVAGEINVLVSTTVIEVGIDVPNATVMIVEGAERFGLSQLHQLRGRVGRGADQSYCIVIHSGREPPERLQIFAATNDGFEIARADLRLRGYGDFFGARQHGLPEFAFADLERDEPLLHAARDAAARIVAADPELEKGEHRALGQALRTEYRERLRLFDVG